MMTSTISELHEAAHVDHLVCVPTIPAEQVVVLSVFGVCQVQVGVHLSVCSPRVLNVHAMRMFVFGPPMFSEYTCDDFRRLSDLADDEHVVNGVRAH